MPALAQVGEVRTKKIKKNKKKQKQMGCAGNTQQQQKVK